MNKKKIILFAGFIMFFLILIYYFLPYFLDYNIKKIPQSLIIYDDNGIVIGEIIAENKYRHRFLNLSQINDFLIDSVVLIEDQRFWNNSGIDYLSIMRALKNNLMSGKIVEGASTISSQLIRNQNWLNKDRTFQKKIKEFILSRTINIKYTKQQILESYLNSIYFGYLNYGFESAANFYFGKSLNNLTKAEQITLITIPKNPNKYDPLKKYNVFRKRFELLVNYLYIKGKINDYEKKSILSEKLIFNKYDPNKLPYSIDFIKNKYTSNKINKQGITSLSNSKIDDYSKTSLDYYLTQKVKEIGNNMIFENYWKDVGDYGVLIVDRKTNEIKVMIGGYDYYGKYGQVNVVTSLRQVGSALKPFTYLLAFRDYGLNPGSSVLDLPQQYKTWEGYTYYPKNFSLDYEGEVSIAYALAQSLNITAVKINHLVGVDNLLNFLKSLGISSLNENPEYYGLALTLGVGEVSLFELLRSFTIFANQGYLCDFKLFKSEKEFCKKMVDKKYVDMIELILTDRYFKLKGFPLNSNLDFPDRYVFVKTGTSRNFSDNVAVGFTNNYLIGVWVGNKDGKNMKGVTGVTGAGEIFKKVVYLLENDKQINKPTNIDKEGKKFVQIVSPLNNSIYKIDNYRPIDNQQIKFNFETNIKYNKALWTINGKPMQDGIWQIQKGFFTIKLMLFDDYGSVYEDYSNIQVVD